MKKFFITENGIERTWKASKKEFEEYKEICLTIWGGCPYNVSWAMDTQIYKNAKEKMAP